MTEISVSISKKFIMEMMKEAGIGFSVKLKNLVIYDLTDDEDGISFVADLGITGKDKHEYVEMMNESWFGIRTVKVPSIITHP